MRPIMTYCITKNTTDIVSTFPEKTFLDNNHNEVASELLSRLYRVVEINSKLNDSNSFLNEAVLINDNISIKVSWIEKNSASCICQGDIVSIRVLLPIKSTNGCIQINRLAKYQQPVSSINLFDTVPHNWVKDRSLVKRASELINNLAEPHRLLFNAIFWESGRFERFCKQPSSMIGHHSEPNGNLKHTIEVAEEMRQLCLTRDYANIDLGVLAAFLHDSGKADEYVPNGKGGWDLTDRGKLLGHKVSAVEWIVSAVTQWRILLPKDHYVGLLHILTAVPHAPDWMGMRAPVTPESLLLSMADRLSGHDSLMTQTVSPHGGFGRYHKHLKSSPFTVRG
jgi:3'-5' exoribonuclease